MKQRDLPCGIEQKRRLIHHKLKMGLAVALCVEAVFVVNSMSIRHTNIFFWALGVTWSVASILNCWIIRRLLCAMVPVSSISEPEINRSIAQKQQQSPQMQMLARFLAQLLSINTRLLFTGINDGLKFIEMSRIINFAFVQNIANSFLSIVMELIIIYETFAIIPSYTNVWIAALIWVFLSFCNYFIVRWLTKRLFKMVVKNNVEHSDTTVDRRTYDRELLLCETIKKPTHISEVSLISKFNLIDRVPVGTSTLLAAFLLILSLGYGAMCVVGALIVALLFNSHNWEFALIHHIYKCGEIAIALIGTFSVAWSALKWTDGTAFRRDCVLGVLATLPGVVVIADWICHIFALAHGN